jgi:1-acyl-sn-glycerol-3-phosphate acyltransferase
MVRATLIYLFVGLYIVLAAPIGLCWSLLSGDTRLIYSMGHFCLRAAGWMGHIKVLVHGRTLLRDGQVYLFLSNHQGNFDGPVLYYATQRNLRAVIKKEIMKIPVLSSVFKRLDFVPVDRADPVQAHASIDRAAQLLRSGLSFFAFPEGTRSRDGRLGEFKKGVFVMAIKAGVPIVPVTIRNSRDIQSPGKYGIRPGRIELVFHEPIATDLMQLADRQRLLQMTREAITRGFDTAPERM